jgi:hypothetical protein
MGFFHLEHSAVYERDAQLPIAFTVYSVDFGQHGEDVFCYRPIFRGCGSIVCNVTQC